jgi:dihydroorotate dehydrogenase electron transfer subunit
MTQIQDRSTALIQTGSVVANQSLCREHYRLTLRVPAFHQAGAGQFVHLCPDLGTAENAAVVNDETGGALNNWQRESLAPMLRRAFSIAALSRTAGGVKVDVIYRVVGKATRWMEALRVEDRISVLGPLGHPFPISVEKPKAWLVAGGVGLPPMLWLAETLGQSGKNTIAFCGAQSADLLALSRRGEPASTDATTATLCAKEFADFGARSIISTDDGSLGFPGHIGSAMQTYHEHNADLADEVVVYTCGPERMMRFVADYCVARNIECHVCMERAMACGTGLCQSCVVPIADASEPDGWRYRLCCKDGPVFAAETIVWEPAAVG